MELEDWIKENREIIDHVIKSSAPHTEMDDEERRLWVLNDEFLYTLSIEGGVEDND